MAEIKFQPSLGVESFFSDDLANDSERFLLFLKAYYEWLQTTKITYVSLSGIFQRNEIITGSTSGATATIKEIGTGYIIVLASSRLPFEIGETITGLTSEATAVINAVKENVVRASSNLLNNRYIETSIDQYQDYLKSELYDSIPKDFLGDKRTVALKFKKYFESKSNEESYRFLFRLLYNEPVEFYYPGEDILRPSDGKFEKTNILRVAYNDNIFDFQEKTIRGKTSGALANVIDVKAFFVGGIEIAEFTLKLVSGIFSAGETIESIDNGELTTTVYGIVAGFTINDGGSGYSVGDAITITGDGSEAQARVSSISDAPISRLKINTIGHGYRLNTEATVNESGTGGSGLLIRVTELANTYSYTDANTSNTYTLGKVSRVQILNRGSEYISVPTITLQDTTIASLGLLSSELITIENGGSDYGVGNTLVFTGGSGANAAGQVASVEESTTYDLLFEDGFRMLSEDSYYDIIKNEDWEVLGAITRVELTNFGDGYETANLPSITITTTTGSGANLIATDVQGNSANVEVDIANNIIGIGAIRAIEVTNFGIDYSSATADSSGSGDGNANLSINISGLGIKEGNWVNDDGKLNNKYIQDSFFYQDFSYVIKSGLAFNFYKDIIKNVIHPAGLQPFGQILISSKLTSTPNFISIIDVNRVMERIITFLLEAQVSATISSTNEYKVVIQTVPQDLIQTHREINIKYVNQASVLSNIDKAYKLEPIISVNTVVSMSSKTTRNIESTIDASATYHQSVPTFTFENVRISSFSSDLISTYANSTFEDIATFGSVVQVNRKLTGNVSMTSGSANVIGDNTIFEVELTNDIDNIIINNTEKFIINREGSSYGSLILNDYSANQISELSSARFDQSSLFSNTFITVTVPAVGTYANIAGHIEVL